MTHDEYAFWVNRVINGKLPIPRRIIEDYSNWSHRAILVRALLRNGYLAPAAELISGITNVELATEDEDYASDLEQKIACLTDLAEASWILGRNAAAASEQINQAIELMQSYSGDFTYMVRGEVVRIKLEILHESGDTSAALQEASRIIQATVPPLLRSNSILFHAYYFMARVEYTKGNAGSAFVLLRKAALFYPQNDRRLAEIKRCQNKSPRIAYQGMVTILNPNGVVWDDDSEQTESQYSQE